MVRFLKLLAALMLFAAPCAVAQPIYGPLESQNNLSDLNSIPTAQTNLLGSTMSLSGPLNTTGGFGITLNATGTSNVTLPTSGNIFAGHGLINVQEFCSSGCSSSGGTYTPTAGTNRILIDVQAPGGGSSGCPATAASQYCVGVSSSAGSFVRVFMTTGYSGITVSAPAGGAGGAAGGSGTSGAAATFGSLISCPGGVGGPVNVVGGALTSWIVVGSGRSSPGGCTVTSGVTLLNIPGGGSDVPMGAGTAANTLLGGDGGDSVLGTGGKGQPIGGTTPGVIGTGYGEGASAGGNIASEPAVAGAAGGQGIIIIYEFN